MLFRSAEFMKILVRCATTHSAKGLIELESLNVGTWSECLGSLAAAIPMEESFSLQAVETWQYIPDDLTLLLWPPISPENYGDSVVKEKLCKGGHTLQPTCAAAVVYLFEHSTIQIWELFLCFERSSDQATLKAKQKQLVYKNLQSNSCYVLQPSEDFQICLGRTKILGLLGKFRKWQVFLVSSVKLQPWTSGKLIFLFSFRLPELFQKGAQPIPGFSQKNVKTML